MTPPVGKTWWVGWSVCFKPRHSPRGAHWEPPVHIFLGQSHSWTRRVLSRAFVDSTYERETQALAEMRTIALWSWADTLPASEVPGRSLVRPLVAREQPAGTCLPIVRAGAESLDSDPSNSFEILLIVLTGPRSVHLQSSVGRGLLSGMVGGGWAEPHSAAACSSGLQCQPGGLKPRGSEPT